MICSIACPLKPIKFFLTLTIVDDWYKKPDTLSIIMNYYRISFLITSTEVTLNHCDEFIFKIYEEKLAYINRQVKIVGYETVHFLL